MEYAGGAEWRTPSVIYRKIFYRFDACPPPWTDGCHLSPTTIKSILYDRGDWKSRFAPAYYDKLSDLPPDEVFERIPHDVFKPGEREDLLRRREEIRQRHAARVREEESDRLRRLEKYGTPGGSGTPVGEEISEF